ncbi:MAG: UDP-N-acetylmuramoyl-L-alanyl-D-glutamate--2,6-diaminopimelate ligase [Kiritimatiellae bacterium]|nr:UDP-N-acetylmuramoyl-L-alanyl-D-glutamate--2,6-diaminopimelate ligase [Kiritimatiellia bacterium]
MKNEFASRSDTQAMNNSTIPQSPHSLRVWGVTGTNGKTTVTWILAEFMRAAYITTVEVNTLARRFYTGYTTPPLARLKEIFAEMEAAGARDCAMEVSSHAIHQGRTGDTVFAGGAFTNLSEDHLDYHKTMEEYFRVKLSFAELIARQHSSAPASAGRRELPPFVVCLDGGYAREMLEAAGRLPLNVIPVSAASPRFDLSGLQLVGDYNKSNVLVAAALAEAAGVPHDDIQRIIPTLTPRWGRLEPVACASPADVYVDFAHTPDGLEKVLSAARGFTRGRLWVVFGAGGDRDPMKRPLMGEAAAKLADRIVVTSDNPRSEEPEAIIADIMRGIPQDVAASVAVIPDRREAIRHALAGAAAGDVVLICGKGHETTQEIKGVKHPFDDRAIVRAFSFPPAND